MPKQSNKKNVYSSKIFTINQVDINFDNGKKETYEIMDAPGSVMVVPIDADNNILFVREYCAGLDDYCIGLPKGRLDSGSAKEMAQQELQEEIGYKAGLLYELGELTMSPGYSNKKTYIFLALDLKPSKKEGDEPEKLSIIKHPLVRFEDLINSGTITEARVIASLFKAKKFIDEANKNITSHMDTVFI